MNIANISALSSSVKQEMQANADVKNFVSTSTYFCDLVNALDIFLQPVLQAPKGRKLEQSYKVSYEREQPEDCKEKPILLFAPLNNPDKNGKISAYQSTWIARLPLLPNVNSVSIYFPSSILKHYLRFHFYRW